MLFSRYHMLVHNTRGVLGHKNVVFLNRSILDIIQGVEASGTMEHAATDFNMLFLDPEWGMHRMHNEPVWYTDVHAYFTVS